MLFLRVTFPSSLAQTRDAALHTSLPIADYKHLSL